jgi:hypothetical protein
MDRGASVADEPVKAPTYCAADLGLDDDELSPADVDPQMVLIDRRYQRPLNPEKTIALAKAPEEVRQAKPILVGIRASGALYGVDGQHRTVAALLAGDPSVPALVFPSDGRKDEQEKYLALQRFERDHGLANLGKPDTPQAESSYSN